MSFLKNLMKLSHSVKLSFPTRLLISTLLISSTGIVLKPSLALAVHCRDIGSVQDSANIDKNDKVYGGHITQHIDGLAPPAKTSQQGKTLFESRGKFENAWKSYQLIANPVICSKNQAQQVVDVKRLNFARLGAFSCTKADAEGRCTEKDSYEAKEVFFGFIFKDGVWILNTAYPIPITQ